MREGLVYKSSNPSHNTHRNEFMDSKAYALAMCHILHIHRRLPNMFILDKWIWMKWCTKRRGSRRVGFWCINVVIHFFIQTWVQPVTVSHQYWVVHWSPPPSFEQQESCCHPLQGVRLKKEMNIIMLISYSSQTSVVTLACIILTNETKLLIYYNHIYSDAPHFNWSGQILFSW